MSCLIILAEGHFTMVINVSKHRKSLPWRQKKITQNSTGAVKIKRLAIK